MTKKASGKHVFSSTQARIAHLREYRTRVGKAAEQEQRQGDQEQGQEK